jgi:hypothetical protein
MPSRSRLTRRTAFGASGSSSRRPSRKDLWVSDFALMRRARPRPVAASTLMLPHSRERSRRRPDELPWDPGLGPVHGRRRVALPRD